MISPRSDPASAYTLTLAQVVNRIVACQRALAQQQQHQSAQLLLQSLANCEAAMVIISLQHHGLCFFNGLCSLSGPIQIADM